MLSIETSQGQETHMNFSISQEVEEREGSK